jgi:fusion and transport protein UGO1
MGEFVERCVSLSFLLPTPSDCSPAGQLTSCILDGVSTAIQPFLLSAFSVAFLPASFSSLPLIYSPRPLPLLLLSTISHTVTTIAVSPLDLIRTRLIVQSAQPQHRKYKNPLNALTTIIEEEGGLWNTYFHSNLFFPALLEGILRPLITLSTPLIIARYLHLEPSTSPLTFGLAELVLSTAGLLLTIPIETVRKRLQIQSRAEFVRAGRAGGVGRPWRTTVETRPVPYAGIVEAVYRILTEETGKIPRRRRIGRRRSSAAPGSSDSPEPEEEKEDLATAGLGASGGLRQLYRGFGMGVGANVVVFLLGLIAGGDESSGWAEM